jgi:hypothetical protein
VQTEILSTPRNIQFHLFLVPEDMGDAENDTYAVVAQTEILSKRRDTRFHLFLPVFTV